jgi:hypothetical protein
MWKFRDSQQEHRSKHAFTIVVAFPRQFGPHYFGNVIGQHAPHLEKSISGGPILVCKSRSRRLGGIEDGFFDVLGHRKLLGSMRKFETWSPL